MREHSWMRSTKEFFYFVRLPFSSDCGIYPRDKNTLVVFDFFFRKGKYISTSRFDRSL